MEIAVNFSNNLEIGRFDRDEIDIGLGGFNRGNFDDCSSSDPCNSYQGAEDESEDNNQLIRRRRRSDLEGDNLAESSAIRRRHSRVASNWSARQAYEMFTTMERRNRESELIDLARLHTVSTLDSSFLRESRSPTSRGRGSFERPNSQVFTVFQMWRELEDEHLMNHGGEGVRVRYQRNFVSNSTLGSIEVRGSDNRERTADDLVEFGRWPHDQILGQINGNVHSVISREESTDLSEVDREHVRQIARAWMGSGVNQSYGHISDESRAELLDERERERVRVAMEWAQMTTSQGRGSSRCLWDGSSNEMGTQVLGSDPGDVQPEHIRRHMMRLRGRQALINLLMRSERERRRELQGITNHRVVSDFAYRNRIQSLLRGRFLRNERNVGIERPPSMTVNELIQLRQRHTVSGLREGFRYRLENIVRGQVSNNNLDSSNEDSVTDTGNVLSEVSPSEVIDHESHNLTQTSGEDSTSYLPSNIVINVEGNISPEAPQETNYMRPLTEEHVDEDDIEIGNRTSVSTNGDIPNTTQEWRHVHGSEDREVRPEEETNVVQSRDIPEENSGSSVVQPSISTRDRRIVTVRRPSRFHPPDDDNMYNVELRELLSRRSVSNLLRSGFRESLDQLIQSYVERHGHVSMADWDHQRNLSPSPGHNLEQQRDEDEDNDQENSTEIPLLLPSPPPLDSPHVQWHQDLRPTSSFHHDVRHNYMDGEPINEVRAYMVKLGEDVARLHEEMGHMQRMVETCMDVFLELQRSVRQEVSAAMNRSTSIDQGLGGGETSEDGSRCGHVRMGVCCVCCDDHIDCLLYRCGHMCTCSKCAHELVRGGGKCPLCRAPIVEVIQAYSVL